MDDERVARLAEILIACHGISAENVARNHANRCRRRNEPEWAARWREVAGQIAKRLLSPMPVQPQLAEPANDDLNVSDGHIRSFGADA
jgi:hypothetical protein